MERFDTKELMDLVRAPDFLKIQADGAKVLVQQVGNRYNVLIFNEQTGKTISAVSKMSKKSVLNLGANYGWTL